MIDWNKPLRFVETSEKANWKIVCTIPLDNNFHLVTIENKYIPSQRLQYAIRNDGLGPNLGLPYIENISEKKWRVLQTIVNIKKEFSNRDDAETYINRQAHIEGYSYSVEKVDA